MAKRFFAPITILFIASSLALPVQAASAVDEQWRPAQVDIGATPDFHKQVQIVDLPFAIQTFSYLWAENKGQGQQYRYVCNNMTDKNCASPIGYTFQSILPVCKNASDINCVEGLEAGKADGSLQAATFKEYNLSAGTHPNSFTSLARFNIPQASDPSIWQLPFAPHAGGDLYVVNVAISGERETSSLLQPRGGKISAFISPVSIKSNVLNELGQCRQAPPSALFGVLANSSCTGSDFSYKSPQDPRCVTSYGKDGACLVAEGFPADFTYSLKLRLDNEPNGWFHGRISDSKIDVSKSKEVTSLTVTATPVQVPILYQAGFWKELGQATKNWWINSFAKCAGNPECGPAGGSNPTDPTLNIETTSTGLFQFPYGGFAMNIVNALGPDLKDKAVAAPRVWSFKTLDLRNSSLNSCISDKKGLQGIVSTNSTTYSEGAPEYSNGSLNYRVASLHYLPDGKEFKGSYDLIMRSSVARCLYSFSQAPISGKIEIVSENGIPQIATTAITEKNGWLYLSAKNFSFSGPTVKVKLTQESTSGTTATKPVAKPTVKKITCIKGKTKKTVTGTNPKCPSGYRAA